MSRRLKPDSGAGEPDTGIKRDSSPAVARLARNVQQLRSMRGLTQQALADLIGSDRRTIIRLEQRQTTVGLDVLEQLANALRVPLGRLIDGDVN